MKKITDGNLACSKVAYLFSEVCSIYPITPSSTMATNVDNLVSTDLVNLYNDKPKVLEMQSEAGAAGAMHGALLTGSLASTFTASQGLLLMLPNMYKMAGEMLPGVVHVAARSIATHSLSIFGDHQDVYAARQTGFCMLASTNVFDAQNMAAVAHLSAIEASLPFMHFFDGFRTSHELNTIDEINHQELLKMINYDKLNEFKKRSLNLNSNMQYGMAENEDIYFQNMETRNLDYAKVPNIVNEYMSKINKLMNTDYKPFNYYGHSEAENIIVAMGSVCDTIKEYIKNSKEEKIGLIEVHLYRPFSVKYLLDVLPKTVKNIAVLDRTKEAGSIGEPLYLDLCASINTGLVSIYGGRYGLSSKNVTPSDINDVYFMLKTNPKHNFTIGINDDVTNLSLEKQNYSLPEDTKNIKIYGFGSDGMVSASKNLLKIMHEINESYVQGYFEYDSKKSGGVTVSNLRFGKENINKPYYVESSSLVVVTKFEYFNKFDCIRSLEENGVLLISTSNNEETINNELPNNVKECLIKKNIKVYYIDAEKIASENNIKGKISKIMESIILHLLGEDAEDYLINSISNTFKNKGQDIIENNINAVKKAKESLLECKIDLNKKEEINKEKTIYERIGDREGNDLSVSEVMPLKCGAFPCGLTKNEKRKISVTAPIWKSENCIQCNMCSIVCPHAVIRPFAGEFIDGMPLMGDPSKNFTIKVSTDDCTGCGLCVNACPGKMGNKALEMSNYYESDVSEIFDNHINPKIIDKFTIKGSQFEKPLFEFSGACSGCGETPYVKLLTQLFGKNIAIANATGCSSIYGGSAPSTPYSLPWANSLFEDNAEFAMGMHLSYKQKRERLKSIIENSLQSSSESLKTIYQKLLDNFNNDEITNEIKLELEKENISNEVKDLIEFVPARKVWALGGDGWAYDIGYGGLDHIIHSNENIKILVLDTEVYSNTGGQASKATKMGAVAEFANMGKTSAKKDLFKIATCAPNCYVGSIALGANMMHTLKTFKEADAHDGPAIIIAYSPCIAHGIKNGMYNSIEEEKLAVESGYQLLMRYNPVEEKLYLDSKEPIFDKYLDFLNNETRFKSLSIKNKELADKLFELQKQNAIKRYEYYKNLSNKN